MRTARHFMQKLPGEEESCDIPFTKGRAELCQWSLHFLAVIRKGPKNLRMIRIDVKRRIEERLASRLGTSTLGLDCDEDRVDLCKRRRVVEFQRPTLLTRIVLIK